VPQAVRRGWDLTPDGRFLVAPSGNGRITRLWELAERRFVADLETPEGHNWLVSPDGRTLACVQGDSTILLWDLAARPAVSGPGSLRRPLAPAILHGHTGVIFSLTLGPDVKTLAR